LSGDPFYINKRSHFTGGVLTPPVTKGDANAPFGNPIERFHATSNVVTVKSRCVLEPYRNKDSVEGVYRLVGPLSRKRDVSKGHCQLQDRSRNRKRRKREELIG